MQVRVHAACTGTLLSMNNGHNCTHIMSSAFPTASAARGKQAFDLCLYLQRKNKDSTDASHCTSRNCSSGYFSSAIGADSIDTCKECPAGTVQPVSGADNVSYCLPCGVGTFNELVAQSSLASCLKCAQASVMSKKMRICLARAFF